MNCSIPDCDNPQEGQTGFCASHNYQMRKSERDAKKIKIARQTSVTPSLAIKPSGDLAIQTLPIYRL